MLFWCWLLVCLQQNQLYNYCGLTLVCTELIQRSSYKGRHWTSKWGSPTWSCQWLPAPLKCCSVAGLPAVREKSGKIFIFQGQGKVREFCEKSGKIFEWRKVREFCDECPQYFFYGSRHPFVPHLSASYRSRLHKSLHLFWCYVIFSAHNSFPGRKYVFAVHSLLTYHT